MGKFNSPPGTYIPLPLPQPLFDVNYPYQSGITDPIWPDQYPGDIDRKVLEAFLKQQIAEGRLQPFEVKVPSEQDLLARYQSEYAGRVARQDFQSVLRADVLAKCRTELRELLKQLSTVAITETNKKPSKKHIRLLEPIPDSYRVTITVAFGATLFVDQTGHDRYQLRSQKPRFLKVMPSFEGDHASLNPQASSSDLMVVIASDHPYVNTAIVRFLAEFFNKNFSKAYHPPDAPYDVLRWRDVEEGFARKDKREFLKFDDGIENLQIDPADLRRLVYVDASDNEPRWCEHGAYLVYRKIRELMPIWEALDIKTQERMIGRNNQTGAPLGQAAGKDGMTPEFPDTLDGSTVPLTAHIRKVQPRRAASDLFGLNDLERRFLRRPYPFFDGLDENGQAINGLQFMAFMKSIQRQFEHVVNMWQMNPHFPAPDVGADALYASGVLSTIDGGYYFCPPGLKNSDDFFGSGMFGD